MLNKGRVLRCGNPECHGKLYAQIMNWIQKVKIENIGDALLEALMFGMESAPLVQDIIDLYCLTPAQLENLQVGSGGRLGPSMASKVVESIHERGRQEDLLPQMSDDHVSVPDPERPDGAEHVAQHRHPANGVKDFGKLAFHARPRPSGEDDGGDFLLSHIEGAYSNTGVIYVGSGK